MKLTQLFDFADNPVFRSVTGLLNTTWDANNIQADRAATEGQLAEAVSGVDVPDATEHYLISADPNIIITTTGTAGEADVFLASKHGASNHVAGFISGEDKIRVPLEVIQDLNASTEFVKGACKAEKFTTGEGPAQDVIDYSNNKLTYSMTENNGDTYKSIDLLTLSGDPAPTVAATDIEIV